MKSETLRKRLGLEPGPTMIALVKLAKQLRPDEPSKAFEVLGFELPWLDPDFDGYGWERPRNVHRFASSNSEFFGFLMDREQPTDDRPIVLVVPQEDDATEIVAPNLRALLGLLATGRSESIRRDWGEAEWSRSRQHLTDRECAEAERLSTLLCALHGVHKPAQPWVEIHACPNQAFVNDCDDEETQAEPQPKEWPVRLLLASIKRVARKDQEQAEESLEELLAEWLSDAPAIPPWVHARDLIPKTELIAVIEQVMGAARSRDLVERIRDAKPVAEFKWPEGDVL